MYQYRPPISGLSAPIPFGARRNGKIYIAERHYVLGTFVYYYLPYDFAACKHLVEWSLDILSCPVWREGVTEEVDFHDSALRIRRGRKESIGFDLTASLDAESLVNPMKTWTILRIVLRVFSIRIENQLSYPILGILFTKSVDPFRRDLHGV